MAQDPLHGVTLEALVTTLVEAYGFDELALRIPIHCFQKDPSIPSTLKFLRRTPWARAKTENFYLFHLRFLRRTASATKARSQGQRAAGADESRADVEHERRQEDIYQDNADGYDALISAEDVDGELTRFLSELVSFDDAVVADIGAGTGRLARLLGESAAQVDLVERAQPMLDVAAKRLEALGRTNHRLFCADARDLPLASATYDVVVAGWVFGHFRHWMPDGWQQEVSKALEEMRRIVKPGGRIIIIETLGTGHETPRFHAPLEEYFSFLEGEGFTRSWIRTDYLFESVDDAADVLETFFGEAMGETVRAAGSARVPECTGIFSTISPQ